MSTREIPHVIHYVYARQEVPAQFSKHVEKVRSLHPGWEINVWDDLTAFSLVRSRFPEWLEKYSSFKHPVQRADVFRVMITYLQGGFYMDLDMLCFESLDELCEYGLVLGVEKTMSQEECGRHGYQHRLRIANYMFGSRCGHPFWLDVLTAMKEKAGKAVLRELDILESTGPGPLTEVFHNAGYNYPDLVVLPNDKKACLKECGPASCHFGTFAAHLHAGSWRWEKP